MRKASGLFAAVIALCVLVTSIDKAHAKDTFSRLEINYCSAISESFITNLETKCAGIPQEEAVNYMRNNTPDLTNEEREKAIQNLKSVYKKDYNCSLLKDGNNIQEYIKYFNICLDVKSKK